MLSLAAVVFMDADYIAKIRERGLRGKRGTGGSL